MAYFPIDIPPGLYKNGTARMASGRWHDSNLVRWREGALQPEGGWRNRQDTGVDIQVSGAARAAHIWRITSDIPYLAIGTHTHLYVLENAITLADVTPVGFTAGSADATIADGYGMGDYGDGDYGMPAEGLDEDIAGTIPATNFTLDNWGDDLIAHATSDGVLYVWDHTAPTDPVVAITNAPTACHSFVITAERFLMALGPTDPRLVQWSDQEDYEEWTPSATNQAGDLNLQTNGHLICGRRIPGATLLFTTEDVWRANYQGPPFVYGFEQVAIKCGIASAMSAIVIDSRAVWMGANGFWIYSGYVQPLPSEVGDHVFSNINKSQISKVWGMANHEYMEARWFYPSSGSTEIDSYVTWNWRDNIWWCGSLIRTCGVASGIIQNPIMIDADGYVFNHETGYDYDGAMPYAESGPLEISNGNTVVHARQFIPDEATLGDVTVSFKTRFYPTADETVFGPYTLANPTDVRFTARQVQMKVTGERMTGWRFGKARIEGVPGGLR